MLDVDDGSDHENIELFKKHRNESDFFHDFKLYVDLFKYATVIDTVITVFS